VGGHEGIEDVAEDTNDGRNRQGTLPARPAIDTDSPSTNGIGVVQEIRSLSDDCRTGDDQRVPGAAPRARISVEKRSALSSAVEFRRKNLDDDAPSQRARSSARRPSTNATAT
jgi:hypothetical protein